MKVLFKEWVVCIFSYNRGALLENLLTSLRAFYPEMNVAIFDDKSTDTFTLDILQRERRKGTYVYVHEHADVQSKHGRLYALMNIAIAYACSHSVFRYAYYVQDDMQFLWRDEELNDRVKTVFSRTDCLMCNANFLQKILKRGIANRLVRMDMEMLFAFKEYGVADTGIIDLAKARQTALHFPFRSERENGRYWYEQGFCMYWLTTPHLGWTPWPLTFRNRSRKAGNNIYVLQPLSDTTIQLLRKNTSYAYLEDYTGTQRYLWKPYWYSVNPGWVRLLRMYARYYLDSLIHT